MNKSLWINSSEGKRFSRLNKNIRTKCLIVGGGIAGITTAYLLSQNGVEVTLVEADYIGYGATGRNTGKVSAQHNIIYSQIYKLYGIDEATRYYQANKEAIDLIKSVIKENKIECDYEDVPSYIYTEREEDEGKILEEFNVCKEIGIDCEFTMDCSLPFEIKGAIKFEIGGQFNPKKYIDALAEKVEQLGGEIYEKTPMKSLEMEGDLIKIIGQNGYSITTDKLIITSHFPFYDGLSFYFARLKPERSYVVASEYDGVFPNGTFINIDTPKRSFRIYKNGEKRYLLIGGESHKVAHKEEKDYYEILKNYGREVFKADDYMFQWSAQDYITPDSIPYIGYLNSIREKIFVATGFAKWGMTNGTAAAIALSDIYLHGKSKYLKVFNPSRTEGYYTVDFMKENIDNGIRFVIGKLKLATKDLPSKGEAKICSIDKKKYGVYVDDNDKMHIVDIVCTHLGCELKWNHLEKSWDCPCHGSRFSIDGEILEGPATVPLQQYGSDTYNKINPNLI